MRKILWILLMGSVFFLWTIGSSSAYLINWQFNPDGQNEFIYEYLNTTGATWVKNDINMSTGTGTFEEWGFLTTNSHDNGSPYNFLFNGKEVTSILHAWGDVQLGGDLIMTGGDLTIYYDDDRSTYPYEDASSQSDGYYYGTNDGEIIAQFSLKYGYGTVDIGGMPNGQVSTKWEATFLKPGVFIDENGNDLANTTPLSWIIATATTNASYITNVSDDQVKEMAEYANVNVSEITNNPPADLWVSANGQFRLSKVPEPATMFLLGSGLIGFVGIGRKKFKRNKA